MAMGEGNVEFKKDDCEEWLHSVQAYRRKCAARGKAPAKPITCSSLLSLQLTQLEAGIESLPIKGLNAGIFMKGLNVLFGVAKSVLSFHLDPNLLKDTASLLKDVTTRVRAKFARACFTELAFIDRTVLACTTHTRAALVEEGQGTTIAETNGRLRDMMTATLCATETGGGRPRRRSRGASLTRSSARETAACSTWMCVSWVLSAPESGAFW